MLRIFVIVLSLFISSPTWPAQTVSATLTWAGQLEISTPLTGVIDEILVQPGEQVAKGAPLLRLDRRYILAERDAARALRTQTKGAREEALREKNRTQELYDRTLLSDHDVQVARIAYNKANAAYQEARARLAKANQQADYSELKAPFDARIITILVQPGQTVVNRLQAVPLIRLVKTNSMLAITKLDDKQLSQLELGQSVNVVVNGTSYPGKIQEIGFEPVSKQGPLQYSLHVEFELPPENRLRKGQPAQIDLP